MTDTPKTPPILDAIADKVLRYHPPEKGVYGAEELLMGMVV